MLLQVHTLSSKIGGRLNDYHQQESFQSAACYHACFSGMEIPDTFGISKWYIVIVSGTGEN